MFGICHRRKAAFVLPLLFGLACGEEDLPIIELPGPVNGSFPLDEGFHTEFVSTTEEDVRGELERLVGLHIQRLLEIEHGAARAGLVEDAVGFRRTGECETPAACRARAAEAAADAVDAMLPEGQSTSMDGHILRWEHEVAESPGLSPIVISIDLRSPGPGAVDLSLWIDGGLTVRARIDENVVFARADIGPAGAMLERLDFWEDLQIDLLDVFEGRMEAALVARGPQEVVGHLGLGADLRVVGAHDPVDFTFDVEGIGFYRVSLDGDAGRYTSSTEGAPFRVEVPVRRFHEEFRYEACVAFDDYRCENGQPGVLVGRWEGAELGAELDESRGVCEVRGAGAQRAFASVAYEDGTSVGHLSIDDFAAVGTPGSEAWDVENLRAIAGELGLDVVGLVGADHLMPGLQSAIVMSARLAAQTETEWQRHPRSSGPSTPLARVVQGGLSLESSDQVAVSVGPGECLMSRAVSTGTLQTPFGQLVAEACP